MSNRVFVPELTAPPSLPGGAPFHLSGVALGTNWSASGFGANINAADLNRLIEETLQAIVHEMSQWEPTSHISRFNTLPPGGRAELPAAFCEVLSCALEIAKESEGAFDPSIGALVDLWGFGPRPIEQPPTDQQIAKALSESGWRKLSLEANRLAQPGGLQLDFAGIAKGYAVDCVARALQEHGVSSCLVEIGGELRGSGVKADGQPWWVEIERQSDAQTQPIVAALYNLSIATSGDYQRGAWVGDQRISHTIDPRTGRPLISAVSAVTVLHPECMRADAYATALMNMGVKTGLAFADSIGLAAMFTSRGANGSEQDFSAAFLRQLDEA